LKQELVIKTRNSTVFSTTGHKSKGVVKMKKTVKNLSIILLTCLILTLLSAGQALAQTNISVTVFGQFFKTKNVDYGISATYFKGDDSITAAYIAARTGRALPDIHRTYLRYNHNWFDVMVHYGVQPSTLFIPVPATYHVGPPYGNAYGYWKKQKKDPKYVIRLTNQEISDLVYLNVMHQHFGTPAVELMNYRQAGHSFNVIAEKEYHKAHKNKGKDKNIKAEDKGNKEECKGNCNENKEQNKGQNKGKGQPKGKK
jgi:hypothetical protein